MAYRKFNIYDGVQISIKALSIGIVIGIGALVFTIFMGSREGFTASFDSAGGQAVSEQHLKYGENVKEPPVPVREGYVFDGWYIDSGRTEKFDFKNQKLRDDIRLYAAWHENNTTTGTKPSDQNQHPKSTKNDMLK